MSKIHVLYCPQEGEPKFMDIEGGLDSYYRLINCDTIDMKGIHDDGLSIIIDDNGRFNEDKKTNKNFYPLMQDRFGMGIVGDYLFVKVDYDTGDTVSLDDANVEYLKKIIDLEKTPALKEIIETTIKQEEDYIKNNPHILNPVMYSGKEVNRILGIDK